MARQGGPRYLVTGGSGFLGAHLLRRLAAVASPGAELLSLSRRSPLEPAGRGRPAFRHHPAALEASETMDAVREYAPHVVLHLAASTDPDRCERDPAQAEKINLHASRELARAAAPSCRLLVYVSTDLVFDGRRGGYHERDRPNPLSVYGRTKLEGEAAVVSILGERALIARLALLYGRRLYGGQRPSFAETMIAKARKGEPVPLFTDQFRTPLHVEDAADGLLRLARDAAAPYPPVVHLGGAERVSRYEMGAAAFETLSLPPELLVRRRMDDVPAAAPRPRDVSLDTALARRHGLPARPLREGFLDWKGPERPEP